MTEIKPAKIAREALKIEIEGLKALEFSFDEDFDKAVELILKIKGRVIVSGMGKSGHVARKIAATLASTGTPALFIHPSEASHGDLGMLTRQDVVILFSNSGETVELHDIILYAKRFSIPLIGVARRETSKLISASDFGFVLPDIPEACSVDAPTTSTTMMMAWGDALAIALMEKRNFDKSDFHNLHPGGKLGAKFLIVEEIMHKGENAPMLSESAVMSDAVMEMSQKRLGCVVITDNKGAPSGIITDGDLRRHMSVNILQKNVTEIMSKNPKRIKKSALAAEALSVMNEMSITGLIVIDSLGKYVGFIHIHDILRAGVK
jgi:arabinose-5-phosphate isomerase